MPEALQQFVRQNADTITIGLIAASTLLIIGFLVLYSRLGRLHRLYTRLTRNTSGGNVEEILHEHISTVGSVAERIERMEAAIEALAQSQRACIQKAGVVRFDAFEEVGGEQSFAIALLDADHSGVVLSSVYSRRDMRVYAKSVAAGTPSHTLTDEEQLAVARAEGR